MLYHLTDIPVSETVRYALGAQLPTEIPDFFLKKAQSAADKLLSVCSPSYCYRIFPSESLEEIMVGKDIKAHLQGSSRLILFAATLGSLADTLIRRSQVTDMEQALWLDAAASAAIEQLCNRVQEQLSLELHCGLTDRFSCGYGDFPLELQPKLISALDAGKAIGLSCSSSGMLIPVKSVTAVMGILPQGESSKNQAVPPCSLCFLKGNCQLRRKGVFCGK